MLTPRELLSLCNGVYYDAKIVAGPRQIDGMSVLEYPSERVLVIRGTLTEGPASFDDWLNDLHADPVYDAQFPGRVHSGFLRSFHDLADEITLPRDRKTLTITGHSKGGALAFLAAWAARVLQPRVITFGAPRVGSSDFAAAYDGAKIPTRRYENPSDLVPKLPLWMNYRHVGDRVSPPTYWRHPVGVKENHSLATGYSWVI